MVELCRKVFFYISWYLPLKNSTFVENLKDLLSKSVANKWLNCWKKTRSFSRNSDIYKCWLRTNLVICYFVLVCRDVLNSGVSSFGSNFNLIWYWIYEWNIFRVDTLSKNVWNILNFKKINLGLQYKNDKEVPWSNFIDGTHFF